ncbi:TIC 20-I, chloroplastic-like protein [Drosera capensis]
MALPGIGCGVASAPSMVMPFNPFHSRGPTRPRVSVSHSMVSVARHRISRTKLSRSVSVAGGLTSVPSLRVSAASTRFLSNEPSSYHVINPLQPKRKTPSTVVQFFKLKFKYPPMTKKPEWYWRFLAALPYLIPIHETWQHAETAYHLFPFLETFELLTMPFYRSLQRFPTFTFYVYFICAYIFIVRGTILPHFLRFHVLMGMLVSITIHIFGEIWKSLPISLYWGKVGAHFWTAVAFGHLLTCLVCLGCALNGKYADVPGLADAAYMQMSYD